jgi:penicillin-binding protein 1C
VISRKDAFNAKLEHVTETRTPRPQNNRQLQALLAKDSGSPYWTLGGDGRNGLITTIDPLIQEELDENLKRALAIYPREVTAAGIVMDNRGGEILAYNGNARKLGTHPYVDCARARRSPGSALKPFIYLEAYAKSLLTPSSLLADTPDGLMGLAPRNFTGIYRGPVSAKTALSDSLNVPAVRVFRLIGESAAKAFLNSFGFTLSLSRDYGDSLVLGGTEVSLLELVRAYGTLSRGGVDLAPSFLHGEKGEGKVLASEAAVWLLNYSLMDDSRLPLSLQGEGRPFKTGTSHGLRDAWFVMYSPRYTVALWMGDPAGRGHAELSGAKALSMAAVEITRALNDHEEFRRPESGLREYLACPVSGEPVGPHCPGAVHAYALDSGFKTRQCRLHQREWGKTVLNWPFELRAFMNRMRGGPLPVFSPQIISPLPGGVFIRTDRSTHIPLKAEGAISPVYWYVDRKFYTREDGSTPAWPLEPGPHEVSFIDANNRSGGVAFAVRVLSTSEQEIEALEFN